MLVRDIRTEEAQVIRSDATVLEAGERMWTHAVGSLVVVDEEGVPVGMLTDRDIALRIVARERDPARTKVADVQSSPLVQVGADTPVDDAIRLMRGHGLRRLPVIHDGRPSGVVAYDDVLRSLTRSLEDLCDASRTTRRRALRRARFERAREELEDVLGELGGRVAGAKWKAQGALLEDLDEIRSWFRKTLERFE